MLVFSVLCLYNSSIVVCIPFGMSGILVLFGIMQYFVLYLVLFSILYFVFICLVFVCIRVYCIDIIIAT